MRNTARAAALTAALFLGVAQASGREDAVSKGGPTGGPYRASGATVYDIQDGRGDEDERKASGGNAPEGMNVLPANYRKPEKNDLGFPECTDLVSRVVEGAKELGNEKDPGEFCVKMIELTPDISRDVIEHNCPVVVKKVPSLDSAALATQFCRIMG
eukprot:TRINITY_DN71627_c0_g1_i2.p1 TRINITY_DN71627_c0_g1~~TRINITY_DN71627_c0_g1_i2.p1  ORF type:complete len:157 (+),score=30.07 TRINITY_DN71627_c0_g1_i2:114-584(+)